MHQNYLKTLAQQFVDGQMDADAFVQMVGNKTAQTDDASVDLDRRRRCGFPEVVYGEGKSVQALTQIFEQLLDDGSNVLATRIDSEQQEALAAAFDDLTYNPTGRTLRITRHPVEQLSDSLVAVITAGTTDAPVAEEAMETLDWMGINTRMICDVGVAGPHRLPERLAEFQEADAVVVVAGMEGALPSVVGGHVPCPVIAVPTSVGYGAAFGGVAAMLGMLNSCASNVTVVNIDAGFKAAYVAGTIAKRIAVARNSSPSVQSAIPTQQRQSQQGE